MGSLSRIVEEELQLDGIIGPTHHFGGLGVGNVASLQSRWRPSHPRSAALEGCSKMDRVAALGVPQFFLPPLARPDWSFLARVGFAGGRSEVLKRCGAEYPQLLSAAYSSSFMWTANAATTAPASDTTDGKARAVIANLCSSLHRGMEADGRHAQLAAILYGRAGIEVESGLPSVNPLRDEGAANHMRLCGPSRHSQKAGLHVFVHEPVVISEQTVAPKYASRQGSLASRVVASRLRLPESHCVFLEQTQAAIDFGVFHNDVIATSHRNVLIYHRDAFVDSDRAVEEICSRFRHLIGEELIALEVSRRALPLEEAVRTYLFNSQIVTRSDEAMQMVCPEQCRDSDATQQLIHGWIGDPSIPIAGVDYVPLSESMANGGGPACLRLRWTDSDGRLASAMQRYRWSEENSERVRAWITKGYAECLTFDDFTRIEFAEHATNAIEQFPL